MATGERISNLRVPALVERYRRAMHRVAHLRELELPGLIDELFPASHDWISDLRSVALDSLEGAENARDILDGIVSAISQDDVPQNPNFVRVMSLHKSKGLTAGSVYLVGIVDGILPTVTSTERIEIAATVEEGRRLFYVALTRAVNELVVSSSGSMDLADANSRGVAIQKSTIRRLGDRFTVRTITSPYIAELGPSAPRSERGAKWLAARRGSP